VEAAFIPRSERSRYGGRLAGESEALPELVAERDPPTKRGLTLRPVSSADPERIAFGVAALRSRNGRRGSSTACARRFGFAIGARRSRRPTSARSAASSSSTSTASDTRRKWVRLRSERFLSSLAVDGGVSASPQNRALAAILFLYRDVLGIDPPRASGPSKARTVGPFTR
jgi:Phage integrase, N-terminal SAM-like domain